MRTLIILVATCCFLRIASAREIDSTEAAEALCARFASMKIPAEIAAIPPDNTLKWDDCVAGFYVPDGERKTQHTLQCCAASGKCNREIAVIYANGWGVKRNYDAATYFLCHADREMAPAEQWSMLDHVERMRSGEEKGDLDYCEHVTSGSGQTFCEQLRYDELMPQLDARIAAVRRAASGPAQTKVDALNRAAERFADAEATRLTEPNLGGTAYPSMVLSEQMAARESFVDRLERYSRTRAARSSSSEANRADQELNRLYRELVAELERCDTCADDDRAQLTSLRESQRAWIAYRDAFIEFYAARWKTSAPEAALKREILTAVTVTRQQELRIRHD